MISKVPVSVPAWLHFVGGILPRQPLSPRWRAPFKQDCVVANSHASPNLLPDDGKKEFIESCAAYSGTITTLASCILYAVQRIRTMFSATSSLCSSGARLMTMLEIFQAHEMTHRISLQTRGLASVAFPRYHHHHHQIISVQTKSTAGGGSPQEDDGDENDQGNKDDNADDDMFRERLERIVDKDDATFGGRELAMLIRKKYGRSYDVQLIKKEFMGRQLLAMNVMWKYREQRSFPLTEEEYLLHLDDVANNLRCWGAVSYVRNSLENSKGRPRIGKAISIFIDVNDSGARANEWINR